MPTTKKLPLLLSALVLVMLALPAGASATLSYVKNPLHPTVFAAPDDVLGTSKIGAGHSPHVSPDGNSVAYLHEGMKNAQELKLAPASGGAGETLMTSFWQAPSLAWAPDSETIAALRGPELGKRKLVLIDVASGRQSVIASGYFSGFSFSPDSSEIAYAVAQSEEYPPRSDVFRFPVPIPGVVNVQAPEPVQLTTDHRSSNPLWGPEKIVFVKTVEAKKRRYGPKNELFLMNPEGRQVKRLTNTKVPPLLQGLFPTDWSADGTRLLAEFEGQDTSYAVLVNPATGGQRPVAGTGENAFVGVALASDGGFILGVTGGLDPGGRHDVLVVSTRRAGQAVRARNAFEPSWSREPKGVCLAFCAAAKRQSLTRRAGT
jgi:Tol biopolymer transport system component